MEEFDAASDLFTRPGAGDEKLYVRFYQSYLKNDAKSLEAGRHIYDDVVFVKIFAPGDRLNIIDRPATREDKQRFALHYAQFEKGQTQRATGTPLAEWPMISRAMAEELTYLGFTTVEQLADADDRHSEKVHGLQTLKSRASAYLEIAKGSTKPIEDLNAKLATKDSEIRQLTEALEALQAQVRVLSQPSKADKERVKETATQ